MYLCCGFCCGQVPSRQRFAARSLITTSFNILQYSLKKTLRTKSFERKSFEEKKLWKKKLWGEGGGFEWEALRERALERALWGEGFEERALRIYFGEEALRRALWGEARGFEQEALRERALKKKLWKRRLWGRRFEQEALKEKALRGGFEEEALKKALWRERRAKKGLWGRRFERRALKEKALRRALWTRSFEGRSFEERLWGGDSEESALRRSERLWTRSFEGENLHTHTCSNHFRAFLVYALRRWGSQPEKCIGSCRVYQRMRWSYGFT